MDVQTQQHDVLVQNLKEVAKEAQEARATAEAERYRAAQLEALLEQRAPKYKEKNPRSRTFNDSPKKHAEVSTQQTQRGEIVDNVGTEVSKLILSN